ncbi:MAG: hypothetical protein R2864_05870 [Syntrophotaleaceae bacterium]
MLCLSPRLLPAGGILHTLPGRALLATSRPPSRIAAPARPKITTGRRAGLLIAPFLSGHGLQPVVDENSLPPRLSSASLLSGLTILFIIGLA